MSEPLPDIVAELLAIAEIEAKAARDETIAPLHIFIALCKQCVPPVERALRSIDCDPVRLRRRARGFSRHVGQKTDRDPKGISSGVEKAMADAVAMSREMEQSLTPMHLFLVLLADPDTHLRTVIQEENLPWEALAEALLAEAGKVLPEEMEPRLLQKKPEGRRGEGPTGASIIDQFGKDYSALAREGKIEPIVGRRAELKQMVRILLRKQKSNPVLLGEPGVGKTALVEGLALYTQQENAPPEVRRMRIVEIPVASLVAGAKYRGDFEERLQGIIQEAENDPDLIIFFDEIHTIVGAGSGSDSMDAANILKPALARGGFRCIGATTTAEYRRYIEKEAAFERRFQPVKVEEPTPEEAREILEILRPRYEEHHQVQIDPEALDAAVSLSVRYLPDRRLPDKARDILDQAAVAKRILTLGPMAVGEDTPLSVTKADVASVVAEWTGIPIERLTASARERFGQMEKALKERVVGQDHAIEAVSNTIRTAMSGLAPPNRPYGVFLFTGPSGVGKTELAKALAEFLFEDERHLVRLDMSEFMEEHSIAKLIGSPPGYVGSEEGGRLTNAVRNTPYSVVLLDEIEKGHPKVFDLFLQVFDDGRLTDAHGRVADFSNTVIILTSNITAPAGEAEDRAARVGFVRSEEQVATDSPAEEALRHLLLSRFRPEFINRISRVVPFQSLGHQEIRGIIDKLMDQVRGRLEEQGIALQVAPGGYEALMERGFRPDFGARGMERVVDQLIVQPIAQAIIEGTYKSGDSVTADGNDQGVILRLSKEEDPLMRGTVFMTVMVPSAREDVAMLLIDLVGSTRMVLDHGDTGFVGTIRKLHSGLEKHPEADSMRFLKGTGDGFLAVYGSVEAAVRVGRDIRSQLGASMNLRMVVHAGKVKVGPEGDPLGEEVHRLFRVEAVSEEDRIQVVLTGPLPVKEIPEDGRIMITRQALDQLPKIRSEEFTVLGDFRLKGFSESEEVWVEK